MLPTDIRDVMHGGTKTFMGSCIEGIIGCIFRFPPLPKYAREIVPVMLAPELSKHSGMLINQTGDPIKPSPELSTPVAVTAWWNAINVLANKGL